MRIPHWFLNVSEFIVEVERHGYRLASRTDCHVKTLDRHGPMPMDNFPPALRIPNSLHLMFGRCPEPGAG